MKPVKISYFISHPIQYFSPLLRELSKVCDLKVYYYSDVSIRGGMDKGFGKEVKWDIPLLDGYQSAFLPNRSKSGSMNNRLKDAVNFSVFKTIKEGEAKIVIINGWSYFSDLFVLFSSRLLGRKVWMRAENPLNQELMLPAWKRAVKKVFLKHILFRFVDRFLYIGTGSRAFFEHYGVPAKRLVFTPYSVDNEFFGSFAKEWAGRKSELRKQLGLSEEKKCILFTGKFIIKKRPLDLLKAFHQLGNADLQLVMVGDGALLPEMKAYIEENKLDNVFLPGFVNQSAMPLYYAAADVFVMCSGPGETWGLSVNEAMNFSMPVVVSDTTGCSTDLVAQGKNGIVFPEGNVKELAEALRKIHSEDLYNSMGMVSGEIVGDYSVGTIVKNMKAAAEAASK